MSRLARTSAAFLVVAAAMAALAAPASAKVTIKSVVSSETKQVTSSVTSGRTWTVQAKRTPAGERWLKSVRGKQLFVSCFGFTDSNTAIVWADGIAKVGAKARGFTMRWQPRLAVYVCDFNLANQDPVPMFFELRGTAPNQRAVVGCLNALVKVRTVETILFGELKRQPTVQETIDRINSKSKFQLGLPPSALTGTGQYPAAGTYGLYVDAKVSWVARTLDNGKQLASYTALMRRV